MKAAILDKVGQVSYGDVVKPNIKDNEVLIAVTFAGICGSDNSLFHGKYDNPFPIIPGHEAVGVIEQTGVSVTKFKIGQRVVIHPNYSCGECDMCRKGLKNICRNKIRVGLDIDGVFAEFIAVPEQAVYALPDSLPDDVAVFAEPLAVSAHGVQLADISDQDKVLVFGAGVIGQLALQCALQHTPDVAACDLVETRLDIAKQLGASKVFSNQQQLASCHNHFDVVFETSGANSALEQAVQLAAPGGTIILLGVPAQPSPVATNMIVRKELTIKGSMIYTDEIPTCVELLDQGQIKTELLKSDVILLTELQQALTNFNDPNRLKTLIKI